MSPTPAFPRVEDQLALVLRGVVDNPAKDELTKKLEKSRATGKPLRVKAGFDPTAPDLHLGHTVLLTKMRQFQDLGHQVIFLIGDFTAMIGDPTGRNQTRRPLTREEVLANAETYKTQVFKVLDPERTEVRFNATWLDALGTVGVVALAAKYTLARMLEREDFKTRFQSGVSISVHELLYPLMQGYDSVALEADVELGGSDQLFNLLVGRALMKEYGQEPQCVLTTSLLEGTDARVEDGVLVGKKMSKSLGNYVGIQEAPDVMAGKLMGISDDLMWRYLDLLSVRPTSEIKALRDEVGAGQRHPMEVKLSLVSEIVGRYHGADAGERAAAEWRRQVSQGQAPADVPRFGPLVCPGADGFPTAALVREAQLVSSGSEGRRRIAEGALYVDGARFTGAFIGPGSYRLKLGKRWADVDIVAPEGGGGGG
ncbi:MAG: tyrosine--tRNA ligase [Deltaproteobacteria bacterium]|nr:tyrosine--tRNA ligase [Deltaproteobacteria bacterium]